MNKKDIEKLQKEVIRKEGFVWDELTKKETQQAFEFSETYKTFLDTAKTERAAVATIIRMAEESGFKNIDTIRGKKKGSGKFYKLHNNTAVALAVTGTKKAETGLNLIASHVDSPRLDLKQNPLYEELNLSMLKTHYYGGIKKYHWLARPLAIHGTVIKSDGEKIEFSVGESDDDPVFTISDLLPHLSKDLRGKKLEEAFSGEKLNILVGSMPLGDDKVKERFKLFILNHLHKTYNIVEEDFISSEIQLVPAGKSRDIGFDRSLIGAYGQDDRICAFTSLAAILELEKPARTCAAVFFDKEEIGSDGNTGAKSNFIEDFVSDLLHVTGEDSGSRSLRKCLMSTTALSADVNAGIEPDYQDVHEKMNAAKIGFGVCVTKFTGTGGKYSSNDAGAELVGQIRRIFNDAGIIWQTGELGKIDQGGGGTVAKFLAEYGMDIIDCGPAVLSMHSPLEISSKADVYMTYRSYKSFYENCSSL